ncbi:hypothetical protein D3C80_1867090 [compost metagenome]
MILLPNKMQNNKIFFITLIPPLYLGFCLMLLFKLITFEGIGKTKRGLFAGNVLLP